MQGQTNGPTVVQLGADEWPAVRERAAALEIRASPERKERLALRRTAGRAALARYVGAPADEVIVRSSEKEDCRLAVRASAADSGSSDPYALVLVALAPNLDGAGCTLAGWCRASEASTIGELSPDGRTYWVPQHSLRHPDELRRELGGAT
jgi:hypothetical protein